MQFYQAGFFIIQPTKQGIPIFQIPSLDGEPKNAYLSYDGKEHALLYRNDKCGMVLDYLNPHARQILSSSKKAFMIEFDVNTEELKRSYYVQIKQEKLPPIQQKGVSL